MRSALCTSRLAPYALRLSSLSFNLKPLKMKVEWIRYGLEEIKFLRSFDDLKLFYYQKLPFFLTRLTGNPIRETEVPPSLQIEPTNHCNLNCICCSRDRLGREKGYMDFNLFQKIINDASEVGVRRIHLYLHGEPLLHPQVIDMIRYIKNRKIGITMATNGMPLNPQKIRDILDSGVNCSDYVVFSILGYSKEVHETIMRGVNHQKVLHNVLNFLELRKECNINGPIIETVFYKMPENEGESREFVQYWRRIVDHVHPVDNISRQLADFGMTNDSIPPRKKTCKNLWERMTVFWNGDVTTCIADLQARMVLGNLKNSSITEIWNSEKSLRIKELHKRKEFNKLDLCSNCDW